MKLFLAIFFVAISACTGSITKCGTQIDSCPSRKSPCPANAICPPHQKLNSDKSGCCCEKCGKHEVYNDCGSMCGDFTCEVRNFAAVLCAQGCAPGCFCEKGYVRGPGKECIKEKKCDDLCPSNEHFSNCGAGCEASCENPNNLDCSTKCIEGCVCDSGFVRHGKKCIPADKCPAPTCPDNESYNACGTACERTCANPIMNKLCINMCVKGCFCNPGFVRDASGKCIEEKKCPKNCPPNETFMTCGTACETTCENRLDKDRACTDICIQKCFCDKGFIRDSNNVCIPEGKCPNKCPRDETWKDCGSSCPATCRNPLNVNVACNKMCNQGCFCNDGLVRNNSGKCVPKEKCTNSDCDKHEEYLECGSPCEPDCQHTEMFCKMKCRPGCFCKAGYLRIDGQCMTEKSCPKAA